MQKISKVTTKTKKKNCFLSRAFYISIFHSPIFLSATTYVWNGTPADSFWTISTSWSPNGVPAAGDTAQIVNVPAPGSGTGAVNINISNGVCGILDLTNSNPNNFIYVQTTDGHSLTFDNGASSAQYNAGPTSTLFSIIGVNVALSSDLTVNNNSSHALSIEGIISGSSARTITNQGTGIFEIKGTTGSNTFAGNVINNSGTMSIFKQSPSIAIQGALTINGGTVQLNDNGQFAATSTVSMPSGTPIFDINGKTTSFTSLNMAAGSTTLQGGSLTLSGALTLGTSTSLSFGGGSVSTSGALSLNSGASMSGSGTLTLAGASSVAYNTGAQGASVSPDVNLSGVTKTFAVALGSDATADLSLTGVVSNGALTKTGTGRLLLSGANTYSGGTTISAGTLIAGANNTMPSTGDVAVSGTFNVNSTTQTIGNFSGSGSTTLGSGSLTTTVTAPSTYSGVISGSGGSLTKAGASTLVLSGPNTYSGGTTISAGTLQVGANNALPNGGAVAVTGTFDVNGKIQSIGNLTGAGPTNLGSGTLTVSPASPSTYSGIISGTGSLVKAGSSTLILSGVNNYSGGTTISGGILSISAATGVGPNTVAILAAGTLQGTGATYTLPNNMLVESGSTIDVSATQMTASGVISGVEQILTKTGAGTLVLSGANTYSGGTAINAGTLQTGVNNTMPSGGDVSVSGTFDLNGTTQSIGNYSGSGSTTLGSGTLTVTPSSPSTYSGTISGVGGSLVKAGSSTLILSGANTYDGGTTISGGTLTAGANNTLPANGAVAVSGTLNVNGTTQSIGNFSGGGNTTLGSGSLTATVTAPSTYSGVISGSGGSLTKAGASTLILSGANTYDGGTTISAGTLQAGANGAIPANSDVSVAGIFDVDTTTQSIANLTGSGSTNIAAAGLLTVAPSSDITYPGTITGAGDVSKQGSSLWQLTGNSTGFTGLCTVAAGELKLNGTLGTGGAGDVTVNSGALFSGNATVGGALSSHGTLSPGNSVGTMVVGSLTLHSDSIVDADINDAMQSDIFTVSPGTAAIDGTLNVNFLPGVYTAGLTYTIVNAPAGVTGTFASVTDNSPDFNILTTYTSTMVTLTIVSPGSSLFFNLPLSGNAKSVADNINAISAAGTLTTDPDLNNAVEVLVGQSVGVISDALQRLDPTPYTTIGATTALVSPMLAEFFAGKKRKSCCPSQFGCEEGKWSLWADPFVMHFDQGARGSQDGFDALASGFAIGAEKGLSKEWKVGVGFAYDHLWIDFDKHRGSSACNDSYLALFADGEGEQWHFACALLGGADAISNERKIQYLSIDSKAHSNYWAGELIGQASGAYFLGPKARQFQFYGTITSDTFFEPAIHEHGAGGLNLKIRSSTSSVLVSQAGVLFKQRKEFAEGCWGPDLWVGYVNEAYLTNGKLRSNFVNQVIPFTTVGVHKTQNLVEAGLSMTLLLNRGLSFTGTYFAQVGGKLAAQNGDLRFRWMF